MDTGTAGAVDTLDDQLAGRLLHERIIVLGADVEDRIANRICAQLLLLSAEDPKRDIALYINSRGGSVLGHADFVENGASARRPRSPVRGCPTVATARSCDALVVGRPAHSHSITAAGAS